MEIVTVQEANRRVDLDDRLDKLEKLWYRWTVARTGEDRKCGYVLLTEQNKGHFGHFARTKKQLLVMQKRIYGE